MMAFERKGRAEFAESQGHILRIVCLDTLRQSEQRGLIYRETARSFRNMPLIIFQLCVLFWLLSALPSYAQKATGGIQGTLTDSTGAAVAGATITLVDEAGGRTIA